MTNEEAINEIKEASDSEVRYGDTAHHYDEVMKRIEAFNMAIKALETHKEPQFLKLYSYLNDMRLAVSPDELTLASKRKERQIKADLLGKILDYMNKMLEPDMRGERDITIKALEQQPRKITLEDVKGYCKPRCLTIISNELLYELTHPKIKALEQQPKWIPCEERLPEKDVNVLTYHRNVSFDYQYVSWIDDYSGKWAGFIGNLPDDVIAWMPLPEAYKKSEE